MSVVRRCRVVGAGASVVVGADDIVGLTEVRAGSPSPVCPVVVMDLRPISGLTLRRALLGTLLSAGRPLTVGEVVDELHAAGATTLPWHAKPVHKVVADMLAHQVRAGRVRRTGRATYAVIASSMSRSTQRRCRHWRERLIDDL